MLALVKQAKCLNPAPVKVDLLQEHVIPGCQIKAKHDLEAIESWLLESENQNTRRAYQLEAQRLALWCMHVGGCGLKDLKKEDMGDFFNFLSTPSSKWQRYSLSFEVEGKSVKLTPFKNPLSGGTLAKSMTVINSLMNFLVEANYLTFNPMGLLKKHKKLAKANNQYVSMARILDEKEWQAVLEVLSGLPEETEFERKYKARCQFIFAMLYFLGLRADECISHTWNAFRKREGKWWFFVEGKGGKQSHLPVHPQLAGFIKAYRQSIGLESSMPETKEIEPLLISKKTTKALSYEQLYNIVKSVAKLAAKEFDIDSIEYQKLMKFSPHWLRHLFASHLERDGVPYHLIQRLLRHSKEEVTKVYLHHNDLQLLEAISVLQMEVSVVNQNLRKNTLCKIEVQGKSAQEFLFERFLYVLEKMIFKGYKTTKIFDGQEVIQSFTAQSKLGQSIILIYQFDQILDKTEQLFVVKMISRAADIRLLKSKVAII